MPNPDSLSPTGSTSLPNISLPAPLVALERPRAPLRVRQLSQWAEELPIGDTKTVSHQMLEKLRVLNHSAYSCKDRLQLLNCLRPVFGELLHAIRQPLRQASIPLERKLQYSADLLQQLLAEIAGGYKLVVMELAMDSPRRDPGRSQLQEAIYLAMLYLGQRLVESYSLYTDPPERSWSDLNQLYLCAERKSLHRDTIQDPYADNPVQQRQNIDSLFKRILLLALAEPYHLMQYEAEDMYRIIGSFIQAASIEPLGQAQSTGEYIIDLDADLGPVYSGHDSLLETAEPRRINISKVRNQLDEHLQKLLRSNLHSTSQESSMLDRQHRDMLLRLADAWNASLQRKSQRFNLDGKVELTSGLNASHYFVSGGSNFTPEIDALRLARDLEKIDDSSHTVFATAYREALKKDRRHGHQDYALNPWWQRNISPIGIALDARDADQQLDVRVGELVVYRFTGKRHRRWQVGVIRWLRSSYGDNYQGQVNVGIMNIANGAAPVGTKAIKGLGKGTDYFRSLLIPRQVSLQQTRSLIVPALLYDVGSELVLNIKQRLSYVRLTRVLLSTRSFTQFEFDLMERPTDFIF